MIETFVIGVGVRGPGLDGWAASRPVLTGRVALLAEPPRLPPLALLAPNERRRAGPVVRLALAVAQEATEMAGLAAGAMHSIFASANGDGALVHAILETLAGADRQVSPTQFHNSVHNAPAGYWSIATGATRAASCLGCHDATAAAALLCAGAEAQVEDRAVLLCAYDVPFPDPLARLRPTGCSFGAAFVLTPRQHPAALARLRLAWRETAAQTASTTRLPALRGLHSGNPAAGLLPLLEALAGGASAALALPLLDGQIAVDVQPCSTSAASAI
jgi:Beta-ketoacyl synthase, N-terminal domain